MKIYKPSIVAELQSYYGEITDHPKNYDTIRDHLSAIALRMWEGLQEELPFIFTQINNYHSSHLGKRHDVLTDLNLSFDDCQTSIANEYGFKDWDVVMQLGELQYDLTFENAVNCIIKGEIETLKDSIDVNPYLISAKSRYGHQATLLHYVASNGIELWRQQVPQNLHEITLLLLEKGADKSATMKVYGGEYDVLTLLVSSAHPYDAGIINEMKAILK